LNSVRRCAVGHREDIGQTSLSCYFLLIVVKTVCSIDS
jgi:hypothetical protein